MDLISLAELKKMTFVDFEKFKKSEDPVLVRCYDFYQKINELENVGTYFQYLFASSAKAKGDSSASYINVAYSGGSDSTALVLYFYLKSKFFKDVSGTDFDIVLHHMDHGIRKNTNDLAVVQKLAKELELDLHIYTPTEDLSVGSNVEERARRERKLAFPDKVFTAHHMDDSVETMFLNLLRGTGLSGTFITPSPFKPFLRIQKKLLLDFVRCFDVEIAHDETNDSNIYRRNRIRNEVIPLLQDIANKDVTENLYRFSTICRETETELENIVWERYRKLTGSTKENALSKGLSASALRKFPLSQMKVLLRSSLKEVGIFPRTSTLEALCDSIVAANTAFQLSKTYRIVKRNIRGDDIIYLQEIEK